MESAGLELTQRADGVAARRARAQGAHPRGAGAARRARSRRRCSGSSRSGCASSASATTAATGGSAPAAPRPSATAAAPQRAFAWAAPAGGRAARSAGAASASYQGYRDDVVLDMRQIEVALRKLRAFAREGAPDELDVDETIDATAKNAGELEVVMRPPRRPNTRVVLLMDVGRLDGSVRGAGLAGCSAPPAGPRTSRSCAPTTSTTASTGSCTPRRTLTGGITVPDLIAPGGQAPQAGHRRRRVHGALRAGHPHGRQRALLAGWAGGARVADAAGAALRAQRVAQPRAAAHLARRDHRGHCAASSPCSPSRVEGLGEAVQHLTRGRTPKGTAARR